MHFIMNGNCNLCYTVHTCNINVIINDFLLRIKFVISRFHCSIIVKPGFHLCLKGVWDMSKVPVTHVSTCVLSQIQ